MNDRELLELAAKAAEISLAHKPFLHNRGDGALTVHGWVWDPLNDGAQSLRLAVTLGMKVVIALGCVRVQCGDANVFESFPSTDATGYVAACRAIVRAAAEIGRTK